jgi:hypothetical protein
VRQYKFQRRFVKDLSVDRLPPPCAFGPVGTPQARGEVTVTAAPDDGVHDRLPIQHLRQACLLRKGADEVFHPPGVLVLVPQVVGGAGTDLGAIEDVTPVDASEPSDLDPGVWEVLFPPPTEQQQRLQISSAKAPNRRERLEAALRSIASESRAGIGCLVDFAPPRLTASTKLGSRSRAMRVHFGHYRVDLEARCLSRGGQNRCI